MEKDLKEHTHADTHTIFTTQAHSKVGFSDGNPFLADDGYLLWSLDGALSSKGATVRRSSGVSLSAESVRAITAD